MSPCFVHLHQPARKNTKQLFEYFRILIHLELGLNILIANLFSTAIAQAM